MSVVRLGGKETALQPGVSAPVGVCPCLRGGFPQQGPLCTLCLLDVYHTSPSRACFQELGLRCLEQHRTHQLLPWVLRRSAVFRASSEVTPSLAIACATETQAGLRPWCSWGRRRGRQRAAVGTWGQSGVEASSPQPFGWIMVLGAPRNPGCSPL